MKKLLIGILSVALVAIVALGLASRADDGQGILGSSAENNSTWATTSQWTVGNTAVLIAPTSTSRTLARIVSTSTVMILKFGQPGTVLNGEPLVSPLVIDLDHMFRGGIWAISNVTGTISVTEFSNP